MKRKNMLILILLLVIGFAAVSTTLIIEGSVGIKTNEDDFGVVFIEALINGEGATAVIDDTGKKITFNTSKITFVGEQSILDYKIKNNSRTYDSDVTINCTTEESEYIDVVNLLEGEEVGEDYRTNINAQEIKSGSITAEMTKSYTGADTSISITCQIDASATERDSVAEYVQYVYTEKTLNGTDPVLADGLTPVTIEDDGVVTRADTSKPWYSYANKKWANAVILEDGATYEAGDEIPEDKIEAYLVWIPKYQYKLWNYYNKTQYNLSAYRYDDSQVLEYTNNSLAQTIDIKFTTEDTTDVEGVSCKTPMTSAGKGNCANGEWMTHPAFISLGVNGIWVGKFETGYRGANSDLEARVTEDDSSKIIVKPNAYSWRNNTARNMFVSSYNYNPALGSHMMKNTEWGAVAYLSHSKYGINKEVNINNNNSFKTGYSSLLTIDQSKKPGVYGDGEEYNQPYNTEVGYLASTTGNITGIYDMSGGIHEYMAAYIDENVNDSGFTLEEIQKEEYTKYFDKYYKTTKNMLYRFLGDATNEVSPLFYYKDGDNQGRYHNNWYGDQTSFIDQTVAWFTRGGVYENGVLAGQFNYSRSSGGASYTIGSRLVLAPQIG